MKDEEPNPPAIVGADHALALLVPAINPPKRGFEGVPVVLLDSSFLVSGRDEVNEPKILVALSDTVFAALEAASFTASRGVAASTSVGPADPVFASSGLIVVVDSSTATGASLLTPDIVVVVMMMTLD